MIKYHAFNFLGGGRQGDIYDLHVSPTGHVQYCCSYKHVCNPVYLLFIVALVLHYATPAESQNTGCSLPNDTTTATELRKLLMQDHIKTLVQPGEHV